MDISNLIDKMKEANKILLSLIESDDLTDENLTNLKMLLINQKILEDQQAMKLFFEIVLQISNNHKRNSNFFNKLEQVLMFFINDINKYFSNSEIFNIFESNKRILLILIQNQIITIDENIISVFQKMSYDSYFKREIDEFYQRKDQNNDNDDLFEIKRKEGENDTEICHLIRNDLIKEFIIYTNTNCCHLDSLIKESNFETNSFLIGKEVSLIEYATFFGSIQIVNYLKMNNIELTPSLWLYSIHSDNPNMIHFLENNKVEPKDKSYQECFEEAIKCQHNNVASYINDNLLNDTNNAEEYDFEIDFEKFFQNSNAYGIHYRNYSYVPDDLYNNKNCFFYCCSFNNIELIKLYIKDKLFDFNTTVVQ